MADAFRRSASYVEKLSFVRGPYEKPSDPVVEDVCATLWTRKGKRIRPHLVYWFADLVDHTTNNLDLYAWAAEAVHTATLLHDDVIDEATIRRGGPTANKIFDNTLPILSGDYLISDVMDQLASRGDHELFVLLAQSLKKLCTGEAVQYQLKFTIPETIRPYDRVISLKTTSLFHWCAMVGPILAKHPSRDSIERYIEKFGRLFQISDDLLDVIGTRTKDRWNDLREGKLNSVTWQLVMADSELHRKTSEYFQRREIDDDLIKRFERHPQLNTVIKKVQKELEQVAKDAKIHLDVFPDTPIRKALQDITNILIDRAV